MRDASHIAVPAPITQNTTRHLAAFVVATRFRDLPADVVQIARRCTLDCLGVSIGAQAEPSPPILLEVLDLLGGTPQATAWLTGRKLNIASAALYNGHLAHVLDFDDSYLSDITTVHGNAVVVPAALAVAEWRGASGAEYLRAMALGYEVMARVAVSAGKTHHQQRWQVSSTVGAFGAAAAAGSLLGLDEERMTNALGIAGSPGGLLAVMGSMAKGLQIGRASMTGVVAALLAERGFTGAKDILTGAFGFHAVFHSDQDIDALVGELGARWELRKVGFKPYACGAGLRASLAGVLTLRERYALGRDDLASIELICNPQVLVPTGDREPRTGLAGKFSAYHAAAVAYVDGAAGPAQFTDARVNDPEVIRVRKLVQLVPDHGIGRDEARVRMRLRDGRSVSEHVPQAPGTPGNPLSDELLARKFRSMADPVLGSAAALRLAEVALRVNELPDLGPLLVPLGARVA